MKRPLLVPLAGLMAGIISCGLLSVAVSQTVVVASLVIAALTIFTSRSVHLGSLFLLFFCAGIASASLLIFPDLPADDVSRLAGDEPVSVEGVVAARPETRGGRSKVVLTAERVYRDGHYAVITGKLLIHVRQGTPSVNTGDRIRVLTILRVPELYGIPGEFDYRRFLAWQGIHVTGIVRDAGDILLMETRALHPWLWRADHVAAALVSAIRRAVPTEEGEVLAALVLGERGGIPPELEDAYAAAGVNHVLSISGFHMAIVALTLFQLLLHAGRYVPAVALRFNLRRDLMPLTLPFLLGYLLIAGPSYAAVRSVIMIGVCIVSLWLERETDGLNILILAALAIVSFQPGALFDISFQLSFLALWGLLVLAPLFVGVIGEGTGIRRTVVVYTAASLAAITATFLPVLFFFNRASLLGLAANAAVIPLVGYAAVVIGFMALPFVFILPGIADAAFFGAGFFICLADGIVGKLASLPALPSWPVMRLDLCLFFVLLTVLTFWRGKSRTIIAVALLVLLVALPVIRQSRTEDTLRVTFFSLGQSEASLLRFPSGETMLIDGGGSLFDGGSDIGARLLGPALRELGVRKIDHMVLSHPHPDHLKGLVHVATCFPVGVFWERIRPENSRDHTSLLQALDERHVSVKRVDHRSVAFTAGSSTVEMIPPGAAPAGSDDSENDGSLIVRVQHGKTAFLFTGDIGFSREKELLNRKDLLRCDVLKVPHHGSRYSSSPDFLDACKARIALISAGRQNSFHLPSGETLERLRTHHLSVYRTDLEGTIEVESDGKLCRVTTFRDRYY